MNMVDDGILKLRFRRNLGSEQMNLYELTLNAESQVEIYKNPDIDEWRVAIDPVLRAVGQPTVGQDTVESICLDRSELSITTSYSVRCCDQTNYIRLPLNILKAEDPVKAANLFRLKNAIETVKLDILHAERMIYKRKETLEALSAEYLRLSL